jgi:hypothetical protein
VQKPQSPETRNMSVIEVIAVGINGPYCGRPDEVAVVLRLPSGAKIKRGDLIERVVLPDPKSLKTVCDKAAAYDELTAYIRKERDWYANLASGLSPLNRDRLWYADRAEHLDLLLKRAERPAAVDNCEVCGRPYTDPVCKPSNNAAQSEADADSQSLAYDTRAEIEPTFL